MGRASEGRVISSVVRKWRGPDLLESKHVGEGGGRGGLTDSYNNDSLLHMTSTNSTLYLRNSFCLN